MKKFGMLFFLCVLFSVLDNTLVPFFAIRGYFPSLLFIFIIFYSINNGSWEGVWLGAFSGFLQDLYFFNGFGINSFINILLCAAAGFIGIGIFKEKRLIPVFSGLILTLVKGVLVFSILYITKVYSPFADILYNSIYGMVVSIFMYKPIYRLCQKEYMQRKWSFYER